MEQQFIDGLPEMQWQRRRHDLCTIRWMDDRLFLWRDSFPNVIVVELFRPDFYCRSCEIQATGDTAFIGLRVVRFRGILCTTVWPGHFDGVLGDQTDRHVPRLMAWESFGGRRAKANIIMAHCVRIVDHSVGSSGHLISSLTLQLHEVMSTGCPLSVMRRVLWSLHSRLPFLVIRHAFGSGGSANSSLLYACNVRLQSLREQINDLNG